MPHTAKTDTQVCLPPTAAGITAACWRAGQHWQTQSAATTCRTYTYTAHTSPAYTTQSKGVRALLFTPASKMFKLHSNANSVSCNVVRTSMAYTDPQYTPAGRPSASSRRGAWQPTAPPCRLARLPQSPACCPPGLRAAQQATQQQWFNTQCNAADTGTPHQTPGLLCMDPELETGTRVSTISHCPPAQWCSPWWTRSRARAPQSRPSPALAGAQRTSTQSCPFNEMPLTRMMMALVMMMLQQARD
jgi:hypothetical protein